jgi:hypothetical protein
MISRFTEAWLTFSDCGWTRFGDVSRSQSCMSMGASKELGGGGLNGSGLLLHVLWLSCCG